MFLALCPWAGATPGQGRSLFAGVDIEVEAAQRDQKRNDLSHRAGISLLPNSD